MGRLHHIQVKGVIFLEYPDVNVLVNFLAQLLSYRSGYPQQAGMPNIGLPQFQGSETKAVVVGDPVLLDISTVLQGGQDAENIVFMKFESPGQFSDPEFILFTLKRLHNIQGVIHRLDNIIGFFPFSLGHLLLRAPGTYSLVKRASSRFSLSHL